MRKLRRIPWGAGRCLCFQEGGPFGRQGMEVTTPQAQGEEDRGGRRVSPEVEAPVAQEGSGEAEVERGSEPAPEEMKESLGHPHYDGLTVRG